MHLFMTFCHEIGVNVINSMPLSKKRKGIGLCQQSTVLEERWPLASSSAWWGCAVLLRSGDSTIRRSLASTPNRPKRERLPGTDNYNTCTKTQVVSSSHLCVLNSTIEHHATPNLHPREHLAVQHIRFPPEGGRSKHRCQCPS